MTLHLRPIEDQEFVTWLPRLREEYAQDLVRDFGISAEEARRRSAGEIDGSRPAAHSVFVIEVGGKSVGHLWLVERRDNDEPTLSVYDIDVDKPHRGRGYGKAAMIFAEEEAQRRGVTRIVLRVGARNTAARTLYRSLGFVEHEVSMSKII